MRLFPTPPYRNEPELLDDPHEAVGRELQGTLRDIRRANIFGLGTWVIKHHLERLLAKTPAGEVVEILDLGTGSGDIPEELCRWAQATGRTLRLTLTDISAPVVDVARERLARAGFADCVRLAVCDAARTPFDDRSFDVTLSSLVLHHVDTAQAKRVMSEMKRLSRQGFIINDVHRARGAWLMAWFLTHFTTLNRLTRHDGPASVLRAYTPRELLRIGREAGVRVSVYSHPFWRMAAVHRCEGA